MLVFLLCWPFVLFVDGTVMFEIILKTKNTTAFDADIIRDVLINSGINLCDIVESNNSGESIISIFAESLNKKNNIVEHLPRNNVEHLEVCVKELYDDDWKNKWKDDFNIFALTDRFDIVPYWRMSEYTSKGGEPIYMDTSFAFGTGLHETTRFMSMFVERCAGKYNSFFDVGTGTGILAMLAYKCGARDIVAIDIDEDAINTAKNNITANKCEVTDVFTADISKYRKTRKYDFVAANLITHDLIRMRKKIVSFVKDGKYLAVSGISLSSEKMLTEAFKDLPVRCIKREKGSKWVAFLFKRL